MESKYSAGICSIFVAMFPLLTSDAATLMLVFLAVLLVCYTCRILSVSNQIMFFCYSFLLNYNYIVSTPIR